MNTSLESRLNSQLEQLIWELTEHIPHMLGMEHTPEEYSAILDRQRAVQQKVRYLKRVLAGLERVGTDMVMVDRAGFGSRILVEDLRTGDSFEYTIMNGDDLDLDAGEVTIGSPVGQSLLGGREGDLVEVAAPQGRRRLRILSVSTVFDMVGMGEAEVSQTLGRRKRDYPPDRIAASA
ncbi:MAG TPA: GreA/GreB family elongation factor [Longimicrobiaceae bacterium]